MDPSLTTPCGIRSENVEPFPYSLCTRISPCIKSNRLSVMATAVLLALGVHDEIDAALRCILHGIGQDVGDDLAYAHLVTVEIVRNRFIHILIR